MSNCTIRPVKNTDAPICAAIVYEAFCLIADTHQFRRDFPNYDLTIGFVESMLANPQSYGIVAEERGKVIGCNFLSEGDPIRGVGPIAVAPNAQSRGVGRKLMEAVLARGAGNPIRLVQDAFNGASFSLYATLGFDVREALLLLEGTPRASVVPGYVVRRMEIADRAEAAMLCEKVLGYPRLSDLAHVPPGFESYLAEKDGEMVAYAAAPHFWALNHSVAVDEQALIALLLGVVALLDHPLSLLVPSSRHELVRFLLRSKMQIVKTMNLMSLGEYRDPRGTYLPSVSY